MPQLGHNLQLIRLEQGHDYSLALIKAESLYQLMYLRIIVYKTTMGKMGSVVNRAFNS